MDKWDYIRAISRNGDRYGYNGGIADLLEFYGKNNTREITLEEAREFAEQNLKGENHHGERRTFTHL